MKTGNLIKSIVVAVTILSVVSCSKKDQGGTATKKTTTDYITSAAWYIKSYQDDYNINGSIDYNQAASDCESDDAYTFGTNNVLSFDPGRKKCDSSDAKGNTTWAFTANETKLTFSGGTYNIKDLNDTLFTIYYDTLYLGTNIREYINFKH